MLKIVNIKLTNVSLLYFDGTVTAPVQLIRILSVCRTVYTLVLLHISRAVFFFIQSSIHQLICSKKGHKKVECMHGYFKLASVLLCCVGEVIQNIFGHCISCVLYMSSVIKYEYVFSDQV